MKEKKRQEREAEKKKEEEELAAIKAEKKKEADEKLAQQARRVAADKKVKEMLRTKGFSTQVIARVAAAEKGNRSCSIKLSLCPLRMKLNCWRTKKKGRQPAKIDAS
jgi:hypothetical protein